MPAALHRTLRRLPISLAALVWVSCGCFSAAAATVVVEMKNIAFVPSTVTIQVGDTVRWVQRDTIRHDTVSTTSIWRSSLLNLNGTFEFTFNTAGTFSYFCTPHRSFMTGTVRVNPAPAVNQPPKVSIISPKNGETGTAPYDGVISVEATDPDGTVTMVELLVNGVVLGTLAQGPYTVPLPGVPAGTYVITAVATDNGGAKTTSDPVTVTIKAAKTEARIENPSFLPDGKFQFTVTGSQGDSYGVEGSDDFVTWKSLTTKTAPFVFVDEDAKSFAQRFYRVR